MSTQSSNLIEYFLSHFFFLFGSYGCCPISFIFIYLQSQMRIYQERRQREEMEVSIAFITLKVPRERKKIFKVDNEFKPRPCFDWENTHKKKKKMKMQRKDNQKVSVFLRFIFFIFLLFILLLSLLEDMVGKEYETLTIRKQSEGKVSVLN